MLRISLVLLLALGHFILLAPSAAIAYEATWHRTDYWSGEYPPGFTLKADVTIQIRNRPNPASLKDIDCTLQKGATYHPWNDERVASSKLKFMSFVRTVDYVIEAPITTTFINEQSKADEAVSFQAGDQWTYLAYYGEGTFRMTFQGTVYTAEPDLIASSKRVDGKSNDEPSEEDEWMNLTCANGAVGWLLLWDVANKPGFDGPNIVNYGEASDKSE